MRIEKLTSKFQKALGEAQSLAVERNNTQIEPAHLLLALLNQSNGTTPYLLKDAGVRVPVVRDQLEKILDDLPRSSSTTGDVNISSNLSKKLNLTDKIAQEKGDQYISSELFLLAALDEGGQLARILKDA